ncbi:MAG: (Fe-S)-binding protein [Actinobacteria bacterium]|nr:(Fe-S)-binding protein [Actinomycetota bacterium]
MVSQSYIDAFIPEGKSSDVCINCGECLQRCPVMRMGREESWREIERLLAGEEPQRVLDECTFCFSCNSYCPHGLRPYNLIMERMVARNRVSGAAIPDYLNYMMTGKSESGYFTDIYRSLPQEDQEILDRWSTPPAASRDTLFIGCYGRTICQQLENSRTLASLPKFGAREACCGEIPHRFGDYRYFSELVERTRGLLEALDTERLVCYCGSCANYLGNIWPNYHGVELPYAVISLYEWLWEKYNAGELPTPRKLSKDVVVSDSCYTSELGDSFYEAIRGLYDAVGLRTVELPNSRFDSLCCGFACGIRNGYDTAQVAIEAAKKLDQILATQVGAVSVNCPGCWAGVTGAATAAGKELKVRFGISDILRAFDEA